MAEESKLPKGMLQQLQQMQEQVIKAQAELASEEVSGAAGGGSVRVTVTGDQRCTAVEIDAALLQEGDVEMLQDLILAALNNALEESRQLAFKRLGPLSGGISV